MNTRKEQTEKLLIAHYQTYPKLQIEDIFKFLHQSSFGCEHLVSDTGAVIEYIREEAAKCQFHMGELVEALDGDYCRVHLEWIKAGLNPETLGKLFVFSAVPIKNGKELLEEKLEVFLDMVRKGVFSFDWEETERKLADWKEAGYPAYHHSEVFRKNYHPAYRVIRKEYALFLPLFLQVDRMLTMEKVTLAIEGGSASGKTTLSGVFKQIYSATVFHMDDFFLRPEQRTQERYAQVGGNIDKERFLEEVLIPMKKNEPIHYRRFDCSTFTINPAVVMEPSEVTVVEGAYSMHPELAEFYNLSVFLDVSSQLQEERIRKRNSPDMAERFFKEWIPMENRYFEEMGVKERCDMEIDII